jgi:hypothetical protein
MENDNQKEDKNAQEFLKTLNLRIEPEPDYEPEPVVSRRGRKPKEETPEVKNANLRIFLTDDQKIKFKLLGISPRVLCENFIDDFLRREDVKEQINIKIKKLRS